MFAVSYSELIKFYSFINLFILIMNLGMSHALMRFVSSAKDKAEEFEYFFIHIFSIVFLQFMLYFVLMFAFDFESIVRGSWLYEQVEFVKSNYILICVSWLVCTTSTVLVEAKNDYKVATHVYLIGIVLQYFCLLSANYISIKLLYLNFFTPQILYLIYRIPSFLSKLSDVRLFRGSKQFYVFASSQILISILSIGRSPQALLLLVVDNVSSESLKILVNAISISNVIRNFNYFSLFRPYLYRNYLRSRSSILTQISIKYYSFSCVGLILAFTFKNMIPELGHISIAATYMTNFIISALFILSIQPIVFELNKRNSIIVRVIPQVFSLSVVFIYLAVAGFEDLTLLSFTRLFVLISGVTAIVYVVLKYFWLFKPTKVELAYESLLLLLAILCFYVDQEVLRSLLVSILCIALFIIYNITHFYLELKKDIK